MKSIRTLRRLVMATCGILAAFLTASASYASTNTFNFDSDPSGILTVTRSGDNGTLAAMAGLWFPSGGSTLETGVSDPSTNGYLAITQTTPTNDFSQHGMGSVIIFDDFDPGLIVAGFTFSCDVRLGGGTDRPADGFSLNYARATDPVLTGGAFSGGPNGSPPSGQEEGTQTGLAISFDAFDNTALDPIGLTIKVDGTVITNVVMATRNGACTDVTSLQTGTNDAGIVNLCWQPLYVNLGVDGRLNVRYKNVTLLTNFQTAFTPSPGRLIFAGRTGASWQEQDVDNIRIVTIAPGTPIIGQTAGNPNGFRLVVTDNGFATPDTNTITLTLDGSAVPVTAIFQTNSYALGNLVTTIGYRNTGILLVPGSTHTNTIHFTGSTFSGAVDATNVFTIPAYTFLTAAQKASAAVNTNLSGFTGRIHQLPVARYPSATDIPGIERQLADGFIDPGTGLPYASIALTNTFNNEVINWNQDQPLGGCAGFFSFCNPPYVPGDDPIPGIDPTVQSSTDNVAAELLTILDLPVGAYQLGVNHDDGFQLSVGAEPRDVFKATVLGSSTAATDTSPINLMVTNAGPYPFRLVWGENTGGAQLEFYLIDLATGERILVNNRTAPTHIVAFRDVSALTKPYIRWVSPAAGQANADRDQPVVVKLVDGSGETISSGSISLKLNGAGTPTIAKAGLETTVTLTNGAATGYNETATLVYSTSLGGPFTNTWTFKRSYFGQVLLNIPLNEGAGTNVAEQVWGFGGSFATNNPTWTNDTPTLMAGDSAVFFRGAGTKAVLIATNFNINLGPDISGTNGDYTLESWVKLPVGFEPASRMILYAYEGSSLAFALSINSGGRKLHTTAYSKSDVASLQTVVPNDGQWHHVAVVHVNGVGMRFYVDGVFGEQVAYTSGPGFRTSLNVSVGGSVGNLNNPSTGTIDRIRVTKGALDPSQFDIPMALAARRAGSSIELSWPLQVGSVIPQSSRVLLPSGTLWGDVSSTFTTNGTRVSTSLGLGTASEFYRLRRAP